MRKFIYIFFAILALGLVGAAVTAKAAGCNPFLVAVGGTGACTFSPGRLLYGSGTGAIQTVATTSVTCTGTASCTGFSVIGSSPITINATGGSGSGNVSTSTGETSGFLAYWTSTNATPATLGKVATTALTASGVLSLSNPISVIGSSASALTLTGGTAGQYLTWLNGVPTWSATTTFATTSNSGGWGFNMANNIQTLNIPTQDGTQVLGLLSAANWSTFNSKQPAGNYITSLTTDVTASGPGAAAATIANNAVTYAKFQQVAANSVVGNNTSATANAISLSTTSLFAAGTAGQVLALDASGNWRPQSTTTFSAGTNVSLLTQGNNIQISATAGASTDFSYLTNYGLLSAATTSPLWARLGLFASSTSHFDQFDVGSTTTGTMATSTFFGNTSTRGNASSTNLFVSSLTSGNCLQAATAGLVTTTAGPCGTVTSIATNNGLTGGTITTSGTIGLAAVTQGYMGNNTAASAVPTSLSTSTQLFNPGSTAGQVLTWNGSGYFPTTPTAASTDFSFLTNYGVLTAATTSPIWARSGVFASSTSQFDQINIGSSTLGTMSTSTNFGNWIVKGNASSTNLVVSALGSAAVTNVCAGIQGLLTISGCNNGTVTSIATNNGITGGTITTTGTIGLANINQGYMGNNTPSATTPTSLSTSTQLFNPGGTAGQVLMWNGTGWFPFATTTFAAGTGISLATAGNAITITNSGVTSLTNGTGVNCSGTSPGSCSLAAITTGVLANTSAGSAIPTATATSSLYVGTTGQNAFFAGTGVIQGTSTVFETSASFVGIASTSPWAVFSINPTASTGAFPEFVVGSSTRTDFVINNAGNVGIASTSPSADLSITDADGTGDAGGIYVKTTTNDARAFVIENQQASSTVTLGTVDTNGIFWQVSTSSTLFPTVENAANVSASTIAVDAFGRFTMGSTTPSAAITLDLASSTNSLRTVPVMVAQLLASVKYVWFEIDEYGHTLLGGPPPVLSSCGTNPVITGNDKAGIVTVGSVSATGCTITFAFPYRSTPACIVQNQTGSITNAFNYTVTASAITVSETALTSDILNYQCNGLQ